MRSAARSAIAIVPNVVSRGDGGGRQIGVAEPLLDEGLDPQHENALALLGCQRLAARPVGQGGGGQVQDGVADARRAHPGVSVEVGGYLTDQPGHKRAVPPGQGNCGQIPGIPAGRRQQRTRDRHGDLMVGHPGDADGLRQVD
ncbi:hypothetical protein OHA25_16480 [Nonomuraea sp. NBC_00507]